MFFFFFFKQKTAYEMRISDWSSDVCSSDLLTNVEARYEYYFAPEQRFTLAGFYKKIENPIEAFSYFNNGIVTSFANAPEADLYGAEVEMLKYVPLGGMTGSGFLSTRRLVLSANYTYSKSKLKVGPDATVRKIG